MKILPKMPKYTHTQKRQSRKKEHISRNIKSPKTESGRNILNTSSEIELVIKNSQQTKIKDWMDWFH